MAVERRRVGIRSPSYPYDAVANTALLPPSAALCQGPKSTEELKQLLEDRLARLQVQSGAVGQG